MTTSTLARPAAHTRDQSLDEKLEETAARRLEATTRHSRSVTDLLDGREELRGVLALADLIHEAVRWAA